MFKLLNNLVAVDEELRPPYARGVRLASQNFLQGTLQGIRAKTPRHTNSFFPRTIWDWNNRLSSTARTAASLEEFKAALQ